MQSQIIRETKEVPKVFEPFTLQLKVETIEEARFLFHTANHPDIQSLLHNDEKSSLNFDTKGANGNFGDTWSVIRAEIRYQGFNEKKEN